MENIFTTSTQFEQRVLAITQVIVIIGFLLLLSNTLQAQQSCATPEPTKDQVKYTLDIIDNLAVNRSSGMTSLPMRVHIVGDNAGNNRLDLTDLNQELATLNRNFRSINIEWYIASIDYINSTLYSELNLDIEEAGFVDKYVQSDAVNVIFTNSLRKGGNEFCGFAYYPSEELRSIAIYANNSCTNSLSSANLTHEFGHFFNLFHTFRGTANSPSHEEAENVARQGEHANCSTTGDLLCDTEADPRCTMTSACVYVGDETDILGASYTPPIGNVMTYYDKTCGAEFTGQQLLRMEQALMARLAFSSYAIDQAPAMDVSNPFALEAEAGSDYSIHLKWKDSAANETGFIIERSHDGGNTFFPLLQGGVGPDVTEFNDVTAQADISYIYRIKASNDNPQDYTLSSPFKLDLAYCLPEYSELTCNVLGIGAGMQQVELGINGSIFSHNSECSGAFEIITEAPETALEVGANYPFNVQLNTNNGQYLQQNLTIWMDWNQNNEYEQSEVLFQTHFTSSGPSQIQGNFKIPECALSGETMMRFRTTYLPNGIVNDPCAFYAYGEAEDYKVQITGAQEQSGNIIVSEYSGIQNNDGFICEDGWANLIASSGKSYLWDNGFDGQIRSVYEPGTYTVAITGYDGCIAYAEAIVHLHDDSIILSQTDNDGNIFNGTMCDGEEMNLSIEGAFDVTWEDGSKMHTYTAREAGTYTATVINQYGCESTKSFIVNTIEAPELSLDVVNQEGQEVYDGMLLFGDTAQLTVNGADEYLWNTGSNASTITATQDGNYSVVGTNQNGCKETMEVNLYFNIILSNLDISLDAKPQTEGTALIWTSTTEQEVNSYVIQKSVDGASFVSIGIIEAKQEEGTIYEYYDNEVAGATSYYRIEAQLTSGNVEYSEIEVVEREISTVFTADVYPNPSQGILNIEMTGLSSNEALLQVFDERGANAYTAHLSPENGKTTLDLSGSLNPGMYTVLIFQNDNRITEKILVTQP